MSLRTDRCSATRRQATALTAAGYSSRRVCRIDVDDLLHTTTGRQVSNHSCTGQLRLQPATCPAERSERQPRLGPVREHDQPESLGAAYQSSKGSVSGWQLRWPHTLKASSRALRPGRSSCPTGRRSTGAHGSAGTNRSGRVSRRWPDTGAFGKTAAASDKRSVSYNWFRASSCEQSGQPVAERIGVKRHRLRRLDTQQATTRFAARSARRAWWWSEPGPRHWDTGERTCSRRRHPALTRMAVMIIKRCSRHATRARGKRAGGPRDQASDPSAAGRADARSACSSRGRANLPDGWVCSPFGPRAARSFRAHWCSKFFLFSVF